MKFLLKCFNPPSENADWSQRNLKNDGNVSSGCRGLSGLSEFFSFLVFLVLVAQGVNLRREHSDFLMKQMEDKDDKANQMDAAMTEHVGISSNRV